MRPGLRGQIVDEAGTPVAGARVWTWPGGDAICDDAGRFEICGLAAGHHRVAAHKDDLYVDITMVVVRPDREPVVLVMCRGMTLRVQVVRDGAPVAGARVLRHDEVVVATTDADGIAWVHGLSPGFEFLQVSAAGCAPEELSMMLADDPGATIERTVSLRPGSPDRVVPVEDGARLTGAVVDPDGTAVPHAQVTVVRTDLEHPDDRTFVADASGHFDAGGLDAGVYDVFAHTLERASPVTTVGLAPGQPADLRLVVARAGIAGVVVDTRGQPMAGVCVSVDSPLVNGDVTDTCGRFVLGGFPPGEHELTAQWLPRHHTLRHDEPVRAQAGDTEVRIVKPRPAIITGRVSRDGVPVSRFALGLAANPRHVGEPIGVQASDGRFLIRGVGPGRWSLVIAAPGNEHATVEAIEVADGEVVDLGDITVHPGARLTGHVCDAAGAPVAGARVTVGHPDRAADREPLLHWMERSAATTTDEAGEYVFDAIATQHRADQRPRVIGAAHPVAGVAVGAYVPVGGGVVDLTLEATGAIVVTVAGFVDRHGSVSVQRRGEPVFGCVALIDPNGDVRFDRLPPGDYVVTMVRAPRLPVAPPTTIRVVAGEHVSLRLVVPPT